VVCLSGAGSFQGLDVKNLKTQLKIWLSF